MKRKHYKIECAPIFWADDVVIPGALLMFEDKWRDQISVASIVLSPTDYQPA